MLEPLSKRLDMIERRRALRSGDLNPAVFFMPRGLSRQEQAVWLADIDSSHRKAIVVRFVSVGDDFLAPADAERLDSGRHNHPAGRA